MADNANATAGDGSVVIATDKILGADYQRVKLTWGVDGIADDASATKPIPVDLANTSGNSTALKVDGSAVTQPVSVAVIPSHAVTNAGTFAVQAAQSGTWTVQPGNTANTTAWKVDGSAVTQPVSGTVTANAAQSGTWTVQPGNTANTTAWKVDASSVAVPITDNSGSITVDGTVSITSNSAVNVAQVGGTNTDTNSGTKSAGTLRVVLATDQPALTNKLLVTPDLPSGASTAAKQPALGTAGASSSDVISVQGIASGTNLPISAASGSIASGAVASGAVASGAFASGSIASGAIAAGAIAAGATSIAENEDAASADGDRGIKVLYKRTDTPVASSGTDGDYEQPQISKGYIWVRPPSIVKMPISGSTNVFTCPNATSHTANDWLSDNSTAGSVTKMAWLPTTGSGILRRIRVRKSDQTVATPTIRVWLWDTTFTVGAGDDVANGTNMPLIDSIGFVDVAVSSAGSDDAVGWSSCDIPFNCATMYGLLQTLTTFTVSASEVFRVDLWEMPS
jgi:hypothetical protein